MLYQPVAQLKRVFGRTVNEPTHGHRIDLCCAEVRRGSREKICGSWGKASDWLGDRDRPQSSFAGSSGVSTEDAEIADVARHFGAEIPFVRPSELAQDGSPELLVWKHALKSIAEQDGRMPDVLVNLPATSPFRAIEDVEACVANLIAHSADLCITVRHAHRSPYFNMVSLNDGCGQLVIKPATPIVNRQSAPEVFEITTVAYAATASYVLNTDKLLGDRVCATIVPEDRSLDIDTELDMAFAEFLLQQKEKSYSRSV